MNLVSDCCGAELLGNEVDYICSACKEHCNGVLAEDPMDRDTFHPNEVGI